MVTMDTPAYNELSFMQRMAVRHAVLQPKHMESLVQTPGALEKALEEIASDPIRVKQAAADYEHFAKRKAQQVKLPF